MNASDSGFSSDVQRPSNYNSDVSLKSTKLRSDANENSLSIRSNNSESDVDIYYLKSELANKKRQ